VVQVVVATPYPGAQRLLERYVGGCLKGIASVRAVETDRVDAGACDILAVYDHSPNKKVFPRRFPGARVIGIRFVIQASGVRALAALPPGITVGVVAAHRSCANQLLKQILDSGIYEPRFVTGSFDDIPVTRVDKFAVAEEMEEPFWGAYSGDRSKVLVLPRSLCNSSVVELINAASDVRAARGE